MKKILTMLLLAAFSCYVSGESQIVQESQIRPGEFTVTSSNSEESSLSVEGESWLTNLSARVQMEPGEIVIPAFSLIGSEPQTVLVRAIGPTLSQYGVSNALSGVNGGKAGTFFVMYSGQNPLHIRTPRWWQDEDSKVPITEYMEEMFRSVGAFPLSIESSESAGVYTLGAGGYTVHVRGTGDMPSGTILLEVYTKGKNMINLSIRSKVYRDGEKSVIIAGFYVAGNKNKKVLVRAIGPGLVQHSVTNVVLDPILEVYHGQKLVATNDDWDSIPTGGAGEKSVTPVDGVTATSATALAFTNSGAFSLAEKSRDSALVLDLPPGEAYTVVARDRNGGTVNGQEMLVEVYASP